MPWGCHKGVQVRHLPDGYLSWLSSALVGGVEYTTHGTFDPTDPKWDWLRESVFAELDWRGFHSDADRLQAFQNRRQPRPIPKPKPARRIVLEETL